jgi:hypothetical protein
MRTPKSVLSSRNVADSPVALRLAVYPDEVYRLPQAGERVRVVSGRAWLSAQGEDITLGPREQITLTVSDEAALVSALHRAPVVLEVLN